VRKVWGLAFVAACGLAAAVGPQATLAVGGCYTHQCDGSYVAVPAPHGNVYQTDTEVCWESAPPQGPWDDFPGQRTYTFTFPPPFAGNQPKTWTAYEAADPTNPQSNNIEATGLNAEFSNITPDGLSVYNATCAEYFVRVVACAPTGASAEAGAGDAADAGLACAPGQYDFTSGDWIDADTYESNAIAATWLDYSGNTTVILHYPDTGRVPHAIDTYVSSSASPTDGGQGWELASGDEALVLSVGATRSFVRNATCTHAYARFEVHFPPASAGDAGADTGADSGAD
jgi:hypothetical protein